MTKRCLQLLRVSTAGQAADDKASLPSQRATNLQTAKTYGLTIVKTIELADVSGSQVLLAPEIQEMLRLMSDPEIHGVIVREFSRLMRPDNFADYAMLQAFCETETLLYLPDGPIDFASDAGMLTGTMRAVMGGLERRELVKKMWRIKEQKRREGGFSQSRQCLPYGVNFNGHWSYAADGERVREAFRLVLAGNTSYASIGAHVGIAPFNLRNILRNPIYTGWRVIDKKRDPSPKAKRTAKNGRQGDRPKIKRSPEEVIRVKVIDEPLVSESQFNQVQQILDLKRQNHWRTKDAEHHRWTYNGYLTCTCGRFVYTKYRRRDYYICSGKCGVHYMRRERLEPELDRLFTERLTRPRFLNQIVAGMQKKVPQADIKKLNDRLVSLESKRNRIFDAYFDNLISAAERSRRTAEVDKERSLLSTMIAKQKTRPEIDVQSLANLFGVFAEFDMLAREDKRQLLNTISPSIIVANYEIEGIWIGLNENHKDRGSLRLPA
jgi:DNA invertase Pin-like site-specific DNA recombinase